MESRRFPGTVGTEDQRDGLQRNLLNAGAEGFEIGDAERFELHLRLVRSMLHFQTKPIRAVHAVEAGIRENGWKGCKN